MKVSLSRPESKKTKCNITSKKNSHANSLIYKEINSQMQQIFSKSKNLNNNNLNKQRQANRQEKQAKVSKKNSYIQMKKNKQKIASSTHEAANKMVVNKLYNNYLAGMNSPINNTQNSDNQEQAQEQISKLKKSIGLKSAQPSSNQTSLMMKNISSSIQNSFGHNKKSIQSSTPNQSLSNTPTGTLSKKSYTKTKIKLQAKLFNNYKLQRKLFSYDYIIGKGGFGKVWKVQHLKTRNQYAMKEMLKSIVITKKSVQSVINQRYLLSRLNSPFLVNMHYSFQDRDTLYLVLDLMEGGDLRYHIGNRCFNEIQSSLEHMHRNNIIHRDIKPQNLVLDSRGYIRITDLGIARTLRANNSCDTSGTPGYMSPEVICRQDHGFASDYFALGVIVYQLMTGKRPYNGRTRNEIRDNMLAKQAQVKAQQLPDDWSFQAADFINRLIQRKPENRLGFSSIQELKNHAWVRTINWDKLQAKQIQSPFIPMMKKKNFDQDEQITIQDEQQAQLIQKNSLLLRKPQFQQLFRDYFYDENENLLTAKQTKKTTASNSHHINQRNSNPSIIPSNKQSKKKIVVEKQTINNKSMSNNTINRLASKKYSEQISSGKRSSTNATTDHCDKDFKQATLKNSKNGSIGVNQIINLGRGLNTDNMETVIIKDGQIYQHKNGQKRKTSTGNPKNSNGQTANFFKQFRF